jgi:hypothetical protein
VTTFVPDSNGTFADHAVVPVAVPDAPVDTVHFTLATPVLSVAVPLIAMLAAVVDTIVNPGETICRLGGVVSGVEVGGCTGG